VPWKVMHIPHATDASNWGSFMATVMVNPLLHGRPLVLAMLVP